MALPAIEAMAAGSLASPDRETYEPDDEKDHRCDPKYMQGEPGSEQYENEK
jgi:hypothetical protein